MTDPKKSTVQRTPRRRFLAATAAMGAFLGAGGVVYAQQDSDTTDTPTVAVADHPDLGEILVDAEGMTLYMFDNDEPGSGASTCYDACAEAWPPLTVEGEPSAGEGVDAELETIERDDGGMQVAANGWPLYYFAPDVNPGDVEGQGVGNVWWALSPDSSPNRSGPGTETGTPEGTETETPTEDGGAMSFHADLSGDNEVPPLDTEASGEAMANVTDGSLEYTLMLSNIENVTQAHIHQGGADENGPVVAFLFESAQPVDCKGGTIAQGTVTGDDLIGPLEGQGFGALLEQLRAGNTYVNVHTEQNPAGEVRGQLEARSD